MIRAGRKVADRAAIAALAGISPGTLRNRKLLKALAPVSRAGARKDLYDLEQAQALVDNFLSEKTRKGTEPAVAPKPIPSLPDFDAFTEHELRGHVRAYLAAEQEEGFEHDLALEDVDAMSEEQLRDYLDGQDLLDLEESRLSIPEDRRPTPATMEAYYYGSKSTRLPDPDRTFYGVDHWFRSTMQRWNEEERRAPGGTKGVGRPVGSKSKTREVRSEWFLAAEARKQQALQMLQDNPAAPAEQLVRSIASKLGVSTRTAWRYISPDQDSAKRTAEVEHRRAAARQALAENPDITGADFAKQMGIGPTAGNRYLNEAGRTASTVAAAAEARRARTAELLQKNPNLTKDDLANALGVTPATAAEYLKTAGAQA